MAGGGSFRAAGCSPLLFLFMGNTIAGASVSYGHISSLVLKSSKLIIKN